MIEPSFPPLLTGMAAPLGQSPFDKARAQATLGSDPGLVVYDLSAGQLDAALVLAPETSVEDAMAMLMVMGLGFADALGALAPPEVAVHLSWSGGIFVNGAKCGGMSIDASHHDAGAEPDWMVAGLTVPFVLPEGAQPGDQPDETALIEEGCSEIMPLALLESWSRHTLVWINRWLDDGLPPVAEAWRGKGRDVGEATAVMLGGTLYQGTFLGLDEKGGMILREGGETRILPLSRLLENI